VASTATASTLIVGRAGELKQLRVRERAQG
jgi:hypothetical protein